MLIPIVSLATLVNGLLYTAVGIILLRRRPQDGLINSGQRQFSLFFISLGTLWWLYSLADFVSLVKPGVVVINVLADVFVYLTSWLAIRVVCFAIAKPRLSKALSLLLMIAGLSFISVRLWYYLPYEPVITGNYIFWSPPGPAWQPLLSGVVAGGASLFFSLTFLLLSWRFRRRPVVFWRSIYMGVGMMFVMLSATLFFLINKPGLLAASLSASCGIIGLVFMYVGVGRMGETPDSTPASP